ncbi:MAG: hypothetical protein HY268_19690 [Deltaproteobacteria bacterium]|nr:hypothetical protein [Deltaproteobacteria bacterium]
MMGLHWLLLGLRVLTSTVGGQPAERPEPSAPPPYVAPQPSPAQEDAVVPPPRDLTRAEKLQILKGQRARGEVTPEEYYEKRAKLLEESEE